MGYANTLNLFRHHSTQIAAGANFHPPPPDTYVETHNKVVLRPNPELGRIETSITTGTHMTRSMPLSTVPYTGITALKYSHKDVNDAANEGGNFKRLLITGVRTYPKASSGFRPTETAHDPAHGSDPATSTVFLPFMTLINLKKPFLATESRQKLLSYILNLILGHPNNMQGIYMHVCM